jgi:hypothetical protein
VASGRSYDHNFREVVPILRGIGVPGSDRRATLRAMTRQFRLLGGPC